MSKNEVKSVEIALEIRKLIIYNLSLLCHFYFCFFTLEELLVESSQAHPQQWVFSFSLLGRNIFQNFVKCQWEFAKNFKKTLRFNTKPNNF
jgi:hypothetical protein